MRRALCGGWCLVPVFANTFRQSENGVLAKKHLGGGEERTQVLSEDSHPFLEGTQGETYRFVF